MKTTALSNSKSNFELISGNSNISEWVLNNHDYVLEKFRQHGAILFRGFDGGLDSFTHFTDLFCNGYMYNTVPNENSRQDVARQLKIQTVDLSGDYFPLHAERSQTPFQADIAFFHCRQAPATGGETTFCDGALLVEKISDTLRDILSKRHFRYLGTESLEPLMNFLDISDESQILRTLEKKSLDHIYFIHGGHIYINYVVPILRKSKFSDKLSFANFLLFSRYFKKQKYFPTFAVGTEIPQSICDEINSVAGDLTVEVHWQDNDYLMLDNTRVMHGRNEAHSGMPREIWSRFGYANFE